MGCVMSSMPAQAMEWNLSEKGWLSLTVTSRVCALWPDPLQVTS